ncbi:MAG TPA: hypothetical protein ENJ84_10420 [Gammaproteobacteria bacterium]|nr:hypothetical protein [Gammaproteobacteria bacterium]
MNPSKREALRTALFSVIDQQIQDNTPPETKITYNRLIASGESHEDAYRLIGSVVTTEIFSVLKEGREYDEQAYIQALQALPKLPWSNDKENRKPGD